MENLLAFFIGIVILYALARFLILPIKVILKLLVNGIAGGVVLVLFNIIGGIFNLSIAITPLSALVAGFLGVPGVLGLLIWELL